MRILLVEDEEKLANGLANNLRSEGFAVDVVFDGESGREYFLSYAYDLVILDVMLPGLDGGEVLKLIRSKNRELPILMLTARDSVQDKVKLFEAGADDYLTKPFSFAELLVRIKALLRRRSSTQIDMFQFDDFELDRMSRIVRRAKRRVELSNKEYALLEYLVVNAGRVLSRSMIVEHVWDQGFENLTNIVDVYIRQLRAKIDEGHPVKLISTVRGSGYIFGQEVID